LFIIETHTFLYHNHISQDDSDDDDDSASSATDEDSSDDSDVSDWGSSSESSSEEEEEGEYAELKGRARWLKKNTVVKEKVVKDKEERGRIKREQREATQAKAVEAAAATKSIIPVETLTIAALNKKVKEIAASRGRRGTDNRQVLRELEALYRLSLEFGPRVEIPILMHVITAQFDLQRTLDDYMETKNWKSCASYLARIAAVLEEGYKLGVEEVEDVDMILGGAGKAGNKMKAAAKAADGAMAAVAADEKLVNPHTVSLLLYKSHESSPPSFSLMHFSVHCYTHRRERKRHKMNVTNAYVWKRKQK
jgi:hypothetical protein